MSYQYLTATLDGDKNPRERDALPIETKSERPLDPAPASAPLSFWVKPQKSDTSPSHQIRTSLHGILHAVELLQKAYTEAQVCLREEKMKSETGVSSLHETTEDLATLATCITQLTLSASLSPKSMRYQRQLKTFNTQALTPLANMQTQFLALQAAHKKLQGLLAEGEITNKEDFASLVATNVDTLATLNKQVTELTQLASKLLGSPEARSLSISSVPTLRLEAPSPVKITALIVDDNTINQKVLANHLKKLGCHYEIASNGQEGVSLWEKKKFDIIFMDINMPVMDGYKATQAIRQQEKEKGSHPLPIICVTANADAAHEAQAAASGMNGFVAKPFTEAAIKAMLRTHTDHTSPPPISSSSEESLSSAGVSTPAPGALTPIEESARFKTLTVC